MINSGKKGNGERRGGSFTKLTTANKEHAAAHAALHQQLKSHSPVVNALTLPPSFLSNVMWLALHCVNCISVEDLSLPAIARCTLKYNVTLPCLSKQDNAYIRSALCLLLPGTVTGLVQKSFLPFVLVLFLC